MNSNYIQFPNIGYLEALLQESELEPIKKEVQQLLYNHKKTPSNYSATTAAQIQEVFEITETKKQLENILHPYIHEYSQKCAYLESVKVLMENRPLVLENCWVNFQKKYEFNPVHYHEGVLSFVIWIDIPFNQQIEDFYAPGNNSNVPCSGHFNFYYTNSMGEIYPYSIISDDTKQNTLLLFPAALRHSVYPFYSSDEYRVSISGNFKFLSDISKFS
jgi:hypothetical protein